MAPSTVILCPLRHESRPARRVARSLARVVVCGPGGDRARAAVDHLAAHGTRRIILFGTCAGLRNTAPDPAPPIGTIIDPSGDRWTTGTPGVTMLTVDTPLWDIEAKRAARDRTGADLADCESASFASACERAGIRWSVIRGISDRWDESLPRQAGNWIAQDGATRAGRVVLDCARTPRLIGALLRLSRRSNEALHAAASRLFDALRDPTP